MCQLEEMNSKLGETTNWKDSQTKILQIKIKQDNVIFQLKNNENDVESQIEQHDLSETNDEKEPNKYCVLALLWDYAVEEDTTIRIKQTSNI